MIIERLKFGDKYMKLQINESQNIEFKQTWKDEYLKTICAFANTDGGKLYIGVDDDGNIIGVEDAAHIIPPYKWIELMRAELNAGSAYVIAEAREAGNVGIYRGTGEVREGLVQEILTQIPEEKILWEAPQKAQQLYFLELIGCNVNLGNIAPSEVIALEAMRIGLRGDTFNLYLDKQ